MKHGRVQDNVREIREIFHSHFDHTWFYIILDTLPIDTTLIREVRSFLIYTPLDALDEYKIQDGVESLERFLWKLEAYLLPNLKEILHVSNLSPGKRIKHKDEYIKMRLYSEVLPANIEKLRCMVKELEATLQLNPIKKEYSVKHTDILVSEPAMQTF